MLSDKEKELLIKGVQSFGELYQVLEQIGVLVDSDNTFESGELKDIIEKAKKEEIDTDLVPRVGGLKEKVEELMRKENGGAENLEK